MSNSNGLTSLAPVYVTGAPDSNIWASKIAPTVVDPLIIESTDGNSSAVIGVNNNGNFVMYPTNPLGATFISGGNGLIIQSPDNTDATFIVTANDGTSVITGNSAMRFVLNSTGGGNSFTVQKGTGAIGNIYDTVYNKPVVQTQVIAETTSAISISGTAAPGHVTVSLPSAGYYELELSAEAVTAFTATTAVQIYCTAVGGGGGVINFTSNSVAGNTIVGGGSGGIVLKTGVFPAASSQDLWFWIATANLSDGSGAAAAWNATWTVKLTQLGTAL
jgi:hypothetical protein